MQYSTAALRGMGAAFLVLYHVHFCTMGSLIPLIVHFEGGVAHQGSKLHLLLSDLSGGGQMCSYGKILVVQNK